MMCVLDADTQPDAALGKQDWKDFGEACRKSALSDALQIRLSSCVIAEPA